MKTSFLAKILISLFILFISIFIAPKSDSTQNYFDFFLTHRVLDQDSTIDIFLNFDLGTASLNQFSIRPISNLGDIWIWDQISKTWVSSNSNWTQMPILSKKLKIKINHLELGPALVSFKIQDKKALQIFETPKHKIWGFAVSKDYIDRINLGMANYLVSLAAASPKIQPEPFVNTQSLISSENIRVYLLLELFLLILGVFIGIYWENISLLFLKLWYSSKKFDFYNSNHAQKW